MGQNLAINDSLVVPQFTNSALQCPWEASCYAGFRHVLALGKIIENVIKYNVWITVHNYDYYYHVCSCFCTDSVAMMIQ